MIDYLDGFAPEFVIQGKGDRALLLVLVLAITEESAPRDDYVGYRFVVDAFDGSFQGLDLDGSEWLVIYTHRSSHPDFHPLLVPSHAEGILENVATWLQLEKPAADCPDIDGSVGDLHAFQAIAGHGLELRQGVGSAVAIRRVWSIYSK